MRSTFVIERSSGLVIVLVLLLVVRTASRPGISGEEPYWRGAVGLRATGAVGRPRALASDSMKRSRAYA